MERFRQTELYDLIEGLGGVSGGTHVCYLSDPIHLERASSGLCELTGYTPEEIETDLNRAYTRLLHPDDVPIFRNFVRSLAAEEGVQTVSYRFLTKDGRVVPAVDTMVSRRLDDGKMWGFSVVRDLSSLGDAALAQAMQAESTDIAEDVPLHGLLRVGFDDGPVVLSADDGMLTILGFSKEEISRNRTGLIEALNTTFASGVAQIVANASGADRSSVGMRRHIIRRVDGSFAHIAKWSVWKESPEETVCQFFVVQENDDEACGESASSLEGLEQFLRESADIVFVIDLEKGSLTCTKDDAPEFPDIPTGFPLVADEVIRRWVAMYVCEDDRDRVLRLADQERIALAEGVEHEEVTLVVDGASLPATILMLREGSRALAMVKDVSAHGRDASEESERGVRIRTFGRFEVFHNGEPVAFKSKKAKEYLALLVDGRGSFVSSREAVSALWPNSTMGENDFTRARKAAMNMHRTLEREGIGSIVEKDGSARRIVPSKVSCDLYDFLDDPKGNAERFHGSYLPEYEWGEMTLAELTFSLYDD